MTVAILCTRFQCSV